MFHGIFEAGVELIEVEIMVEYLREKTKHEQDSKTLIQKNRAFKLLNFCRDSGDRFF